MDIRVVNREKEKVQADAEAKKDIINFVADLCSQHWDYLVERVNAERDEEEEELGPVELSQAVYKQMVSDIGTLDWRHTCFARRANSEDSFIKESGSYDDLYGVLGHYGWFEVGEVQEETFARTSTFEVRPTEEGRRVLNELGSAGRDLFDIGGYMDLH